MAYTAGNLWGVVNGPPGRLIYTYHTDDNFNVVGTGGYFNNVDDNLNLRPGDLIHAVVWDGTPFASGQIPSGYALFVVTTVGATTGSVNIAEVGVDSGGAISSGI